MKDKLLEKYLNESDPLNEFKIPFTKLQVMEMSDIFSFLPKVLNEVKELERDLKRADVIDDALQSFKRYHERLTKMYIRAHDDFEKLIIEGFIKSALMQVQRIGNIAKDAKRSFDMSGDGDGGSDGYRSRY